MSPSTRNQCRVSDTQVRLKFVQRESITKNPKYIDALNLNLLFQNHLANFNQTWHTIILVPKKFKFVINGGTHPFSRGGNNETLKIY